MIVRHRGGSYPIVFTSLDIAMTDVPEKSRIISDSNVARLYPHVLQRFEHAWVVPAGESSKSLEWFGEGVRWLAQKGTKRSGSVVAFGGGVVGDLAGFIAASYMRGVNLIQIPTTLLAMVDSSVGGKVGVDLPEGKNLVGAFKPPSAVLVCPEVLGTLPEREFRSGVGEVLKYGLIMDAPLASELQARPLEPGDGRLPDLILACIRHKATVVERDEFETSGLRATLNFGHTVGHALERVQNYRDWLHGEAIAFGMVAEARLSELLGVADPGVRAEVESLVASHGLPTKLPTNVKVDDLMEAMLLDKKAGQTGLAFSLLHDIGTCKLHPAVDKDIVRRTLNEFAKD